MNHKGRRQLENELLVQGLSGLANPELIQEMANLVSNFPGDKHDFLRDLLNECDADNRYEMYSAIAPKLRFKPLALSQYEAQIAEKAGQMVSQRRMRVEGEGPKAVEVGGHKFAVVPRGLADKAVATLRCHVCNKTDRFLSETPAGAMIEGRKAGWVRDPGLNKEICGDCMLTAHQPIVTVIGPTKRDNFVTNDSRRVN